MSMEVEDPPAVQLALYQVLLFTLVMALIQVLAISTIFIVTKLIVEPLMIDHGRETRHYDNMDCYQHHVCTICGTSDCIAHHPYDIRLYGHPYNEQVIGEMSPFSKAKLKIFTTLSRVTREKMENEREDTITGFREGTTTSDREEIEVGLCDHVQGCLQCQQMLIKLASQLHNRLED